MEGFPYLEEKDIHDMTRQELINLVIALREEMDQMAESHEVELSKYTAFQNWASGNGR
jgi:hypothetical protein